MFTKVNYNINNIKRKGRFRPRQINPTFLMFLSHKDRPTRIINNVNIMQVFSREKKSHYTDDTLNF